MIKRADSVVKRAGGGQGHVGGGGRHRRLASARHKHTRGNGTSWFLKLVVPFVGLGSLGFVVIATVYNVNRLGAKQDSVFSVGFSYAEGGAQRGGRDDFGGEHHLRAPTIDSGQGRKPTGNDVDTSSINTLGSGDGGGGDGDDGSSGGEGVSGGGPLPEEEFARNPPQLSARQEEPQQQPLPPPRPPVQVLSPLPLRSSSSAKKNGKGKNGAGRGVTAQDEEYEANGRKKEFMKVRPNNRRSSSRSTGRIPGAKGGWKGGLGIDVEIFDIELGVSQDRRAVDRTSSAGESAVIINADDPFAAVNGWGHEELQQVVTPMLEQEAALLIICANRADYLERALGDIRKYHPGSVEGVAFAMPVIVSQDGTHPDVTRVIHQFEDSMSRIAPVIHIQHTPPPRENRGYFKLSAHYKWALSQAFDEVEEEGKYNFANTDKVIILEEDLAIAPDFFEYFSAMAPLLDSDETLMAVSAWNDNGQAANVKDNKAVVRTDFFPGLGWMLPRRVWNEVAGDWPQAYWDDWIREPLRRQGRQFLRPEVCRTYHFGKKGGASNNQFGSHLDNIKLNEEPVPFREMDLSYLEPEAFRRWFGDRVRKAPTASPVAVKSANPMPPEVVIHYDGTKTFESLARQFGVMTDFKAGVPRTAYMGVVYLWVGNTKVYLAPHSLQGR